jgi:hypothetical protein
MIYSNRGECVENFPLIGEKQLGRDKPKLGLNSVLKAGG